MPRKPKKPKRMYAGIEAVWTASTWAWRARTMVLGKIHIGSCRDDQRLAHEDYLAIRKRLGRVHRVEDVSALGPALEAVLQRAKARRDPSHVEQDTGGAVRFILKVFREDAPLEGFDDQAFDFFVTRCLEQGRHPDTVRRYVRILNQALRLRGLPTVPALIPRAPRTPMEFFEPHELAEVIGQIEGQRAEREEASPNHGAKRGLPAPAVDITDARDAARGFRPDHGVLDRDQSLGCGQHRSPWWRAITRGVQSGLNGYPMPHEHHPPRNATGTCEGVCEGLDRCRTRPPSRRLFQID
ncbi:MAG: hypothetical protein KDC95_08300 [Planctomycetes bacterium]|nr:hypothetical protein [Planctomycetota bacterium]